jgi:predicted secreted protein
MDLLIIKLGRNKDWEPIDTPDNSVEVTPGIHFRKQLQTVSEVQGQVRHTRFLCLSSAPDL